MKYYNAAQPIWDPYTESARFSTTMAYVTPNHNEKPVRAKCGECSGPILYPSRECGDCGKPFGTEPCVDCGCLVPHSYIIAVRGPQMKRLCNPCGRQRRKDQGVGW